MKYLLLTVLTFFSTAGCGKPPVDPAVVSANKELYGSVYSELREAYEMGENSLRSDVPTAQRQTAGVAIIAKLQNATSLLDILDNGLKYSQDSYGEVTSNVIKALRDEAAVYIAFAQKVQVENPTADPSFMPVANKRNPAAQVRVQAVKQAGEAYDKLPNKKGLIRPEPLL